MHFLERKVGYAALSAIVVVCSIGFGAAAWAQDSVAGPVAISLSEAIRRAQLNEPNFAASQAAAKSAGIDRYLAKAALLPSVTYHNQMLYTQANGQTNLGGQGEVPQSAPVFIGNNTVHEYISQASVNETVGLKQLAEAKVASANAARAAAEMEVARRGWWLRW